MTALTTSPELRNRLMWKSRRGMLELDLLLQGFLEARFDTLTAEQIEAFSLLLETPDDLLLDFLLARRVPAEGVLADIVAAIRFRVPLPAAEIASKADLVR